MSEEIEQKVRQLLGKTELKEIADTAKVFVEVCDKDKAVSTLMIESLQNKLAAQDQGQRMAEVFNNNSMLTQKKIQLQQRPERFKKKPIKQQMSESTISSLYNAGGK